MLSLAVAVFVMLLSTAGHAALVSLYSALAPANAALTWMHLVLVFGVLLAFAIAGQRHPAKTMGLFLAVFSTIWLIAALISARFLETDLLALPIILGAFLVLVIIHFAKLWEIDSKLTSKLVLLSTTGTLITGKSPAMRVETGLRLLETIFPVSEVVVFDLQTDGSLLPVGRARKEASKSSPTERNETWQQTVSQCEKAIADRQTVIVPSEYLEHAAKLAVPLEYDGEIIGVLFVDVRDDYEPDDQLLFEAFAGQLARNFQRNELKSRNLPHSNWWSSFSTQSAENRLSVVSLLDGILKEKSFGALATSHLNEAHAVAYLDGTIAYLNKRICALAGISEEEIPGIDLFSLLDRFRTLVFNDPSLAIRRVLQTGQSYKSELDFPESDQTFQLQIIPVKLPANADAGTVSESTEKPACLLITLKNIAAKKENERLRSDVANLMSHELRTPITSISGFAEMLLLDGNIPEEAREYLSIIASESQRASTLLTNFLSVSNLEQSDKKEVEKVPVKI
ncbi:MAG: hypothetical protein OEM82_13190, partial [Acidobacteriota bacterium]|nr:hypothetical protein [Acidobacteriota bacterium]